MSDESVDVFSFMALRGCERLDPRASRIRFVRDDAYHLRPIQLSSESHNTAPFEAQQLPNGVYDVDLFSSASLSPVGKQLFALVQAGRNVNTIVTAAELQLIGGFEYPGANGAVRLPPIVREVNVAQPMQTLPAIRLGTLAQRLHYRVGHFLRILPDTAGDIDAPLGATLLHGWSLIMARVNSNAANASNLDLPEFMANLKQAMSLPDDDAPLTDWVFDRAEGRYTLGFAMTKRVYFDALYALYVLRKREKVNLEPAITALRALHFMELLAIAEFFLISEKLGAQHAFTAASTRLRAVLAALYPLSADWTPQQGTFETHMHEIGIPMMPRTLGELRELSLATPVINPVFARCGTGLMPFNSITPIGIGDLKVVKQKFLGYRKGEIAHIETVLAGETKTRVHRALEKTEESVSLLSDTTTESSKDTQSTDRFELKREAERVIKNDINVNANAGVTYNNSVVVASVAAGFSYANSKTDTQRASTNFVNEVISKATSRIVARASETRSRTTLFETEETNTHSFNNPATNGNISGIYRWLDKIYEGQIHNFGKRMMFEFIVPEPAAFYVQSRLYAYAASLNLPEYPQDATTPSTGNTLPVQNANQITEDLYETQLKQQYNLGDLPPPPAQIGDIAIMQSSGAANYSKTLPYDDTGLLKENYASLRMNSPAGYEVAALAVSGNLTFAAKGESQLNWQNTLQVLIDDYLVFDKVEERYKFWTLDNELFPITSLTTVPGTFNLSICTKTCWSYTLRFSLIFRRSATAFAAWQNAVYARLQAAPSPANNTPVIDSRITAYEEALKKIEAPQLNDIIAGHSPDANAQVMRNELKRQCISMIAKEFDTLATDDVVSSVDAIGAIAIGGAAGIDFPSFDIKKGKQGEPTTTARFVDKPDGPAQYAATNLAKAQLKGRYVQFLEQAFEWEHLSQVFYPYFWAALPKWVALMNREDSGDPQFTDFLRAGSARVLLAVRPGYENAVLHFLATREPWEGGPSPVIGDPLYVPLYEEIRGQQDTFAGSVPVGEPWRFALPTSLVYLEGGTNYPLINEYTGPAA